MSPKNYTAQERPILTVFYGWSKRFKREAAAAPSFSRVTMMPATAVEYRLRGPTHLPTLRWEMRFVVVIEEAPVIERILRHVGGAASKAVLLPLQLPDLGERIHEVGEGEDCRMGAVEDRLLDVRCQEDVSFRQGCVATDPPARVGRLSGQEGMSGTWPGRVGDAWGGPVSNSWNSFPEHNLNQAVISPGPVGSPRR